jgi:hypothetical protein
VIASARTADRARLAVAEGSRASVSSDQNMQSVISISVHLTSARVSYPSPRVCHSCL